MGMNPRALTFLGSRSLYIAIIVSFFEVAAIDTSSYVKLKLVLYFIQFSFELKEGPLIKEALPNKSNNQYQASTKVMAEYQKK